LAAFVVLSGAWPEMKKLAGESDVEESDSISAARDRTRALPASCDDEAHPPLDIDTAISSPLASTTSSPIVTAPEPRHR
jgi:hypothetical protein